MTKTNNDAAVAAFLAQGGKVRKVAADASLGLTSYQWAKTVRGELTKGNVGVLKGTADLRERVAEHRAEVAHDYAFVGDHEGAAFAASGGVDWHVVEEYKQKFERPRFAFHQDGPDFYFADGGHAATYPKPVGLDLDKAMEARRWFVQKMLDKGIACTWPNPFE
jgi:hypothetical protein